MNVLIVITVCESLFQTYETTFSDVENLKSRFLPSGKNSSLDI